MRRIKTSFTSIFSLVLLVLLGTACQPGPLPSPEVGPGFKEVLLSPGISSLATLCEDTPLRLTSESAGTYLWSTGETTSSITVADTGIFSLEITTGSGTETTAAFVSAATENYTFPNVLSPDGSGINDVLSVDSPCLFSLNLRVVDPLNESLVMFETSDINFEWDGLRSNGKLVPAQSYQVIWNGSLYSGEIIEETYWLEVIY